MIEPAHINSNALKAACVNKWKKARFSRPILIVLIITPSCLRVDSAIIFFRSYSRLAASPDITIVIDEKKRSRNLVLLSNKCLTRIIRYTPAVTSVDECTNALTGVGAAMAAGNQAEKGIWALLVIAAIIKNITESLL